MKHSQIEIQTAIEWWINLPMQNLENPANSWSGYVMKHYPYLTDCQIPDELVVNIWKKEQLEKPTLNDFYTNITEWLLPLGFVEVFKNHDVEKPRRFDFSGYGVRVQCFFDGIESWFELYYDDLKLNGVYKKSGRYEIGMPTLIQLITVFKNTKI